MKIERMRTNHIENPLGYTLDPACFSWIVTGTNARKQKSASIQIAADEDFATILFDSGVIDDIDSLGYVPEMKLEPETKYHWRVTVTADNGDTSRGTARFETGKRDWQAQWITTPFEGDVHPYFRKAFELPDSVQSARVYVCGLGLYELEINGKKVGDEFLTPAFNDYSSWLQVQTFDATAYLTEGPNAIGALLGNGWYKGRFGFEGLDTGLYGEQFVLLCELVVILKDGRRLTVATGPDWKCSASPILASSIYDGEIYDANLEIPGWSSAGLLETGWSPAVADMTLGYERLTTRYSPAIKVMHKIEPQKLLHTKNGETVIDFGQNMTGWFAFHCDLRKGEIVKFQCGELLQDDCFYNENLRSAKQEFEYISNGEKAFVRPHFTFYGFRYLNITGMEKVNPKDFEGWVIYSDLRKTGKIETSHPKVNRLFQNATWGQRGNFLDVPTDCPQRDERMGWTGDAELFSPTACFNMYTPAFFRKFIFDMMKEQDKLHGSVPFVVPNVLRPRSQTEYDNGSCVWGDAATVIPWTIYQFFGDKTILEEQFPCMQKWVDYIKRQDEEHCGGRRLWACGFHFADWLSLDNPDTKTCFGATDRYYVASSYYYYSSLLTAKAAQVLGKTKEAEYYGKLAEEVKSAIQKEYFTETGRIAVNTQTAMVVALQMNTVPAQFRDRLICDLKSKIEEDHFHLRTGLVGTPRLCPVLSEIGSPDLAYTLLLHEDYPSWLYPINMGATTIWERWNSVLPDGKVSDTGMNSMNHYVYGSIVEWMFRYMCGIQPSEEAPGFKKVLLRPMPDRRLKWARAEYESPMGVYKSGWEYQPDGSLILSVTVPFNAEAEFLFPKEENARVLFDGEEITGKPTLLDAGTYTFEVTYVEA